MFTVLIPEATPRPDDTKIEAAIIRAVGPTVDTPKDGPLVGILNPEGNLYRAIACKDRVEMLKVASCPTDLGFTNKAAGGWHFERGYRLVSDKVEKIVVPSFRPSGHRSRRRSSF